MASVLDISVLGYFDIVFPFLLIFFIVFAILQKTKILGDKLAINAMIGVSIALIAIISDKVVAVINFIAPWFVVVFIFLILLLLIFQIMGAKDADIALATKDKAVQWTVLGVALVIIFAGLASVFGQEFLEKSQGEAVDVEDGAAVNATTTSGSFEGNIAGIISHPKILGMIVLFGIAIFAVALLTY